MIDVGETEDSENRPDVTVPRLENNGSGLLLNPAPVMLITTVGFAVCPVPLDAMLTTNASSVPATSETAAVLPHPAEIVTSPEVIAVPPEMFKESVLVPPVIVMPSAAVNGVTNPVLRKYVPLLPRFWNAEEGSTP